MQLLQSWQDSLKLFYPKNLKLFALVTLKSIIDVYKLLLRYWWWLLIPIAIGAWYLLQIRIDMLAIVYESLKTGKMAPAMVFGLLTLSQCGRQLLGQLLLFIACLATRPSVAKKDIRYF